MAQFFEKLEGETKGKNPPQFLSDHPNPENRLERVHEEIDKLGGPPANARRDSPEFEAVKRELMALPAGKKTGAVTAGVPPRPSDKFVEYQGSAYSIRYPENWKKYEDSSGTTFAPDGGLLDGNGGLVYGVIVSVNPMEVDMNDANALENATSQLIQNLEKTNPGLRVSRNASRVKLNGEAGLSTYLSNEAPAGGEEVDWLVTGLRAPGVGSVFWVGPKNAPP